MKSYMVLVKENSIFKFKIYRGDFREFLNKCTSKIYFKLRIPRVILSKSKFSNTWYKRFCEDFYFLYKSGVPIIEIIDIFKENSISSKNRKCTKFYLQVYKNILNGNSLYDSFLLTNYDLDPIFLSLIQVSEEVGKLPEVLENLNNYYSEKINISNNIKSALIYPTLLLILLIVLFNLCILFFIPSYISSFKSQLSNLPNISRAFIQMCTFIKNNYTVFSLVSITLTFLFIRVFVLKGNISKVLSKLKIFKKIYFKKYQLKFIQTLYYIVNSGIDVPTSIRIISSLDTEYVAYSKYIYYQINNGIDFCDALRDTKIFDTDIISIISVGEKSSNLDNALKNIWMTYSKRYYEQLQKTTKLVEPMFILICGVLVLIFVATFILPLIFYDNFNHIWGG